MRWKVLTDDCKSGLLNDKHSHFRTVVGFKIFVRQGFHVTVQIVDYKRFPNTTGNMCVSRLKMMLIGISKGTLC